MQALQREIKKLSSLALFFLIGFLYVLLIVKLFLKEYNVDVYIFSKAVIGSLFAAKAVAIMDATPLMKYGREVPRYLRVLYKTFLYTLAVLLLGILEHLWENYHKTKAIGEAFQTLVAEGHFYNILAVTLCISAVFFVHNIFKEIDIYLGSDSLKNIFLSSPPPTTLRETNYSE